VHLTQEDLVNKLAVFGFTLNQAKIYLAIVRAGSTSVGKIAESTKLYRQDIYKILPKLEEKGIITKTLGTPIVIMAIPVKKALKSMVSMEKKRALERIARMEANLKEISNAVSILHETGTEPKPQEHQFSLLTRKNEITNRADLLFGKAKKECNIVTGLELITIRAPKFFERLRTATNNGAKIRLIIESNRRDERIKSAIERIRPDTNNFTAKSVICKSPKPFQIIDRKEVWISTKKQTPSGNPCVLWSNGENIVTAYLELFERMWNNHNPDTIVL
jgi:sugar-specific transcriptional regulator TrmB